MLLSAVPLSGILMGVLVLGLILFFSSFLCCYTQRKQTQLSTSMRPQQSQTDHVSTGACCAALHRAADRQELSWWRGDQGFSLKKTPPFPLQITVLRENYTGKKAPSLQPRLQDALLLYWKCQIKHTDGGALMQRAQKNDYKTCLMEMIGSLLTDRAQCSIYPGMLRSLGTAVYIQMCSCTLNLVKALRQNPYDACTGLPCMCHVHAFLFFLPHPLFSTYFTQPGISRRVPPMWAWSCSRSLSATVACRGVGVRLWVSGKLPGRDFSDFNRQ